MTDSLPPLDDLEISPTELHSLLEDGTIQLRLVDCREEDEFAFCKIESGELIPLSRFAEQAPAKLLNETDPIVVYCHHGMRSLQATSFLRHKGLKKVWSLNGGIERWAVEIDDSIPRY